MTNDVGIKFMIALFQELLILLQCRQYTYKVHGQLVCEQ